MVDRPDNNRPPLVVPLDKNGLPLVDRLDNNGLALVDVDTLEQMRYNLCIRLKASLLDRGKTSSVNRKQPYHRPAVCECVYRPVYSAQRFSDANLTFALQILSPITRSL